MKEELNQIRGLLDKLESNVSSGESLVSTPFSGLELPDIIRDVVDTLFPNVGPHEAAFYMYLLRRSVIETGEFYIRVGIRPLQTGVVQSRYAGTHSGGGGEVLAMSYTTVGNILKNLETFGAIRKENEPDRNGTLYRIMLPEEIETCQKYRHKLQRETNLPKATANLSADYYNVRENRIKVYERDDYKCRYCEKQLTRFTATLDHMTPVAKGGENTFENLVTACLDCNSRKNVRPIGDFMAEQ